MTKGTKLILTASIILAIGAGVFIYINSKGDKEGEKNDDEQNGGESSSSSSSSSSSAGSTGFKNTTEGNRFRLWVNTKYPIWAKANFLDKTGKYDNSYIRKAYAKYGKEYMKEISAPHLLAKTYLGVSSNISGDTVVANFNNKKNSVTFFNNGRFATFEKDKSGFVSKGNYVDGGKVLIITEGLNKGKTIKSGSVWSNLLKTL